MSDGQLEKQSEQQPQRNAGVVKLSAKARQKTNELMRRAADVEGEIEAHIEAVEQEAREQVASMLAEAEREVEKIRSDGRSFVEDAGERLNETMRLRRTVLTTLKAMVADFDSAIRLVEHEKSLSVSATPSSVGTEPHAEQPEARDEPEEEASEEARTEGEGPAAETEPGATVEIEVDAIRDFEAAHAFERALGALPAVSGVYLKAFDGQTALIETSGVDEQKLLAEMRKSFPISFELRGIDQERLRMRVDKLTLAEEGK